MAKLTQEDVDKILALLAETTEEADPDPPELQELAKRDFLRHLSEDGATDE